MFASNYFAPKFFPRNYFPGTIAEKARYFFHGAFPLSFFADAYFPGDLVTIVPPTPSPIPQQDAVAGPLLPRPRQTFAIHGRADFRLPSLQLSAFGFVVPAPIHATFDGELSADLRFAASGQAKAASISGSWTFTLPAVVFSATGSVRTMPVKTQRTTVDEDQDQAFFELYLLTRNKH